MYSWDVEKRYQCKLHHCILLCRSNSVELKKICRSTIRFYLSITWKSHFNILHISSILTCKLFAACFRFHRICLPENQQYGWSFPRMPENGYHSLLGWTWYKRLAIQVSAFLKSLPFVCVWGGGGGGVILPHCLSIKISPCKSKKDSKNQESIQSSTTPVPGYQMGK